jgi:predicted GNAT superfamily acetyltransferase
MTDMGSIDEEHDKAADPAEPVEIRVLSEPAELRRLVALLNQVWGTVTPIVGIELLRAIGYTGGYVAGAYSQQRMVGGSIGFLARHRGSIALHSHVTGILPGVRHPGLGRQMKLHQRDWAAEQGIDWVTWTFDPLVRRNAWFNISVLGAEVDDYLVDFYGPMKDSINGNDPSDRLLVAWSTKGPDTPPPPAAPPPGAEIVPTPEDIVVLRRTDPAEASTWRLRLREELGAPLTNGAKVVGFTREGHYVLAPG